MNVMKQNIILSCLLSLYAFIHCYYTKDVGPNIQIIFITCQKISILPLKKILSPNERFIDSETILQPVKIH